jgi:hypothetical protein
VASATYTITLPVAATPSFSPVGGSYSAVQTVTISDGTTGATIYYTINGTTPTTSSAQYSNPIVVSCAETLEAIAVASGYSTSAVATAPYTITSCYVTLSWDPSTTAGIVGYYVYRGTSSGGESSTPLNSSPVGGGCTSATTCTYSDTTVAAGTYYYEVTAVGSDGVQSADSNEASATVP